ncbi:piggyBac transposable element-derived protein 4-like [Ischnura elegans]|uniref:piggyBac transposable element-derived protein 4-like n=1 Tax=Ischnura elegans TaxID=197161 RepID=UPI001ED8860A|nr:piggyBac transposable element-derived protein 4-like [Ischnura elegans]
MPGSSLPGKDCQTSVTSTSRHTLTPPSPDVPSTSSSVPPAAPVSSASLLPPDSNSPVAWTVFRPSLPSIQFTATRCLKRMPQTQTPRGYFDQIFCDEVYNHVLMQTEKFAESLFLDSPYEKSRISARKTLEKGEFQIWLGLLFHMGHIQVNRLESYWKTDPLYRIPIFREKMSRDRFLMIMQALHFAENPGVGEPDPSDRLYKIRPLIDIFHNVMKSVVYPEKNLSIDESMVLWTGRLIFRQYVQGKKHKFGIKMYMLTEASGLVLRIHVYTGSADKDVEGRGHAGKVVNSLLNDFKGKGHSVFMDNFYNSVNLSRELLGEKVHTTGTLRGNRQNNLSEIVKRKLKKGEVIHRWSEDGVCVLKWHDRREVLLLSTKFGPEMVDIS